jgi:hypothetical protein
MKIFCHIPRENWIVDRMGEEYKKFSNHTVSFNKIEKDTNVIWLLGSWCWNQIHPEVLKNFYVVCTIHHEVPEKFDEKRKQNFLVRDNFVNHYLTYNEETAKFIKAMSSKPVSILPHWINHEIWFKKDKKESRLETGLPVDKFLVGSFQRDTEGSDLKTPKLEKGPDIFVEKVKHIHRFKKDLHVVLSGWRRQYVIRRLEEEKIPYTYIELPTQEIINSLYNTLDLYIVSSRCEGGPQAIFECSHLEVPIISTKSGQFRFLDSNCIYDFEEDITEEKLIKAFSSTKSNYNKFLKFGHKKVIGQYDDFFKSFSSTMRISLK